MRYFILREQLRSSILSNVTGFFCKMRWSHSVASFNVIEKQCETSTQRSTKIIQQDTEHLTPEMLISKTSTIIQEESNINSKLLKAAAPQNHNTDGLAIKLNLAKEKSAGYNSPRDILSKFIQENLVPKGLEITLEPTIENYYQDFVDSWYINLKHSSIVLMKQIVTYCEKTEHKTQKNINETKTVLKQQLKKEDYEEIKSIIISNESATKETLTM